MQIDHELKDLGGVHNYSLVCDDRENSLIISLERYRYEDYVVYALISSLRIKPPFERLTTTK